MLRSLGEHWLTVWLCLGAVTLAIVIFDFVRYREGVAIPLSRKPSLGGLIVLLRVGAAVFPYAAMALLGFAVVSLTLLWSLVRSARTG